MSEEIKNININDKAFQEAAKKKKKFRRKVSALFLVATLVTGGYVFKDSLMNVVNPGETIENPTETIDTIYYEELDIMIKAEGTTIIDGKEYDLAELKEQYGLAYIFLVEMSEEEINQKYKMLVDMIKKQNEQNMKITSIEERYKALDWFGLNYLALGDDVISEIYIFEYNDPSPLKNIKDLRFELPNQKYISYIWHKISENPTTNDKGEPYYYYSFNWAGHVEGVIIGVKSIDSISLQEKETFIKGMQFYYERRLMSIEALGYSLEDFRLDLNAPKEEIPLKIYR
jgi:hypothetical protein